MAIQKFLVLYYCGGGDEKAARIEKYHLKAILKFVDSSDYFCSANELVNRNQITSNRKRMLKEAKNRRLRAFRFFINKN